MSKSKVEILHEILELATTELNEVGPENGIGYTMPDGKYHLFIYIDNADEKIYVIEPNKVEDGAHEPFVGNTYLATYSDYSELLIGCVWCMEEFERDLKREKEVAEVVDRILAKKEVEEKIIKAVDLVEKALFQPDGSDLLYIGNVYQTLFEDLAIDMTRDERLELTKRILQASWVSPVPVLTAERVEAVRFLLENGITSKMSPELTTTSAEQAKKVLLSCDENLFVDLVDVVAIDSQKYYAPDPGFWNKTMLAEINESINLVLAGEKISLSEQIQSAESQINSSVDKAPVKEIPREH